MYGLLQDCAYGLDGANSTLWDYAYNGDRAGFNSEASAARGLIRACSHTYRSAAREALQNRWVSSWKVSSDRNNAWYNYLSCLGIGY